MVSGFLREAKGISQAARLTFAGLTAAGMSPEYHDLRPLLETRQKSVAPFTRDSHGGVWLLHVNAPEGIAALAATNPQIWRSRYRIGYWAYELPRMPAYWARASNAFHEIWTPSRFVAEAAIASGVRVPVSVMPHPVALGSTRGIRSRARFGLDEKHFVVLAMGDLLSSAGRKNLVGAINIYRAAFPEPGPNRLIVKTHSGTAHPEFEHAARHAAGGREDVVFLSRQMSPDDVARLIASSDVLLSPHRSEGFGLALAEAFLAGIPALATGWSGNLDFMSDLPELLIRYRLVPVKDAYAVYRAPGLQWAEPDLEDAMGKLRALAASSDFRHALAARGRSAVEGLTSSWSQHALGLTAWAELAFATRLKG